MSKKATYKDLLKEHMANGLTEMEAIEQIDRQSSINTHHKMVSGLRTRKLNNDNFFRSK